ncbi:MAG: Amine dehydrogenase [Hydrocarboniphaga sp.]|uniref:amine dehydrogenase large subunit n=1 Tax=Hydrocarboniphaga sp. TaxID=2033016 RepID=UPI0026322678|nr:amine dehydrogenase large subunit [Hydrocarboniphaga sp.]MDB5970923.1 Amine dehydrogenase [Hydrocarboniphaga sp.]
MRARIAPLSGLLLALLASAAAAELPPEELKVAEFPPVTPHTLALLSYEGGVMNRYYFVDGDTGKVLGILPGAYNSALRFAPDGKSYYSADTFYEKIVRGKRSDQITIFDAKTGQVSGEIAIPAKRQLSYTVNSAFDYTEGGRYLLQYNMAPAGSVTVIDTVAKSVLTEIPTAGCGLVYPYAPTAFAMLCANGGMLRIAFNDKGEVTQRQSVPSFFDVNTDPLMQNGITVPAKDLGVFVSYEGLIHELDLAGPKKTYVAKPWPVRGKDEGNWWPSAWQPIAYSVARNLVYVVMRDGKQYEHTAGGTEVWALDRKTHKRVFRAVFEHPIFSIVVSGDDKPLLYALTNEDDIKLYICDAGSGEVLREVEELGSFPFAMVVPALTP